jgi:3-methyladenine DNA glycosylase AlkC
MAEKYSLKDELYNATKVKKVATEIAAVYTEFRQETFEKEVTSKFDVLELKERMYHMRDMLKRHLPSDYEETVNILLEALPEPLDETKTDDDFGDFIYAPYSEFVSAYGCCDEHISFSLLAMKEITKRFSVEFSIRDFINIYPLETLDMLKACAISDNYHERRLASEGLRPKLPWAKKITMDYAKPVEILNCLYADKTRYVTRSVANHLNDIAKINAPLVVETLKRWEKSNKQEKKEMDYIISHALRTLVKVGDVEALALLGYKQKPNIIVKDFALDAKELKIGESLVFSFDIEAKEDSNIMVDYVMYFRTKAGTLNPKVHKLKKMRMIAGERSTLTKKHLFKAGMSTRTFNAGEHKVSLQINGKVYATEVFELVI